MPDGEDDRVKLRRDINEVWKRVYEYLGKNKNKPLDDDYFLKNHWIMYFKYDRSKSEAYADFLLNEYFTPKNVSHENRETTIGFSQIKSYIDSIHESIKNWFYIFNPHFSKFDDEAKAWLLKLNRLGISKKSGARHLTCYEIARERSIQLRPVKRLAQLRIEPITDSYSRVIPEDAHSLIKQYELKNGRVNLVTQSAFGLVDFTSETPDGEVRLILVTTSISELLKQLRVEDYEDIRDSVYVYELDDGVIKGEESLSVLLRESLF